LGGTGFQPVLGVSGFQPEEPGLGGTGFQPVLGVSGFQPDEHHALLNS
jgi:hypothetical protein